MRRMHLISTLVADAGFARRNRVPVSLPRASVVDAAVLCRVRLAALRLGCCALLSAALDRAATLRGRLLLARSVLLLLTHLRHLLSLLEREDYLMVWPRVSRERPSQWGQCCVLHS